MTPLEIARQACGTNVVDKDGRSTTLQLLPPLSPEEFARLEARIPCPLPAEVRALLSFSRGFANGPFGGADFSGFIYEERFGAEDIFPCSLPMVRDICGNFWIVDLTGKSTSWAPIFYACHDPPVIVFQSDDLSRFIRRLQSASLLRLFFAPSRLGCSVCPVRVCFPPSTRFPKLPPRWATTC